MSITGIRFRSEGEFVVLQVSEQKHHAYYSGRDETWRDAKVEDLLDVAQKIRDLGMSDRPGRQIFPGEIV